MLKIGAASSAELGDRWRQRSQETHKQSSHTTNIARFELFFDNYRQHQVVSMETGSRSDYVSDSTSDETYTNVLLYWLT